MCLSHIPPRCAPQPQTYARGVTNADDARLANLLGALTLALGDRMRESTEAAAAHTDAAPAALVALSQSLGGGSIDRLRSAVGLTPSGAVRLVDRLVADGLVERRPAADRRAVSLVLTRSGRQAARRVRSARARSLAEPLAALSVAERATLTRLSEKLVRGVVAERLDGRERGDPPAGGWLCRMCDFAACGRADGRCPAASTAAGR